MASGSMMLIAVGLSMDAMAVSASNGVINRQSKVLQAVVLAVFFGGFQALMAFAGWSVGSLAHSLVAALDHWIAFSLLADHSGQDDLRIVFRRGTGLLRGSEPVHDSRPFNRHQY